MWLIVLSLLAIKSVQSASIGYPYRSLWTYSPLKSASVPAYLRYLDNNGAGSLVGYNNPQPVYAVRQIKYFNSAAPTAETIAINNSEEITKARETYLRAASLQQYQHLKSNIDSLKAEGRTPSPEKLSKLEMLEKIAFTSDFSLIAELPEVKSILHDLEANISGLYTESVEQSSKQPTNTDQITGEIKTYAGQSNIPVVTIEETPEQKQAHEDHLRIYNEQIAHLKQLELEHQKYIQEAALKSNSPQSPNVDKPIDASKPIENSKALTEWERAQQEHFRLWNEAKLRAEKAGYESGEKGDLKTANKQQISAITIDQNIYNPKQAIPNIPKPETQQLNKKFEEQTLKIGTPILEHQHQLSDQAKLRKEQLQVTDQQQTVDTPEVVRAREEHLRLVDEAILRSQSQQEQLKQQRSSIEEQTKISSQILSQQIFNTQPQNLKTSTSAEQTFIEETPEVKKAREEHLRLVQEANQRAQFVEQQESNYKHESQVPILKSQYEHPQNFAHHQKEISQNIQENPQVVKAREQHLRLVHDAQLNTYIKEQNDKLSSFPQQQEPSEIKITGDTAEVQHAREEHLRIFNSIKEHGEQEQALQNSQIFPNPSSEPKDFAIAEERLLELERLREAERLQKEQQLFELDRLREAERLVEEKRQMAAELMRLRLEEEQRLEMERLVEETRLQQEQEELQKLKNEEYQEIIIQTDSGDQSAQIAIIPDTIVEQARSQQNNEVVQQQYEGNPFLKVGKAADAPVNPIDHSASQQNVYLKTIPAQIPSNSNQHNSFNSNSAVSSSDNTVPNVRYVQSAHHSNGGKQQYVKDENVKHNYHNTASYQPADTAVALNALEKATNDHFRAHELVLEQLRLARIQNPSAKDCN